MICTEEFKIGRKTFVRTWSDAHRYIVRENIEYVEALDPKTLNRTYTEGEEIREEDE